MDADPEIQKESELQDLDFRDLAHLYCTLESLSPSFLTLPSSLTVGRPEVGIT